MYKYKVSKELVHFLHRVLVRCFYKCHIEYDPKDDNIAWIETNADADTFRKITRRAECEKETKETGQFHMTLEESQNSYFRCVLMDFAKETSACIIDATNGAEVDPFDF